jgi:hypothetical protein
MAPRLVTNAGMPDNFGRLPAVELAGASMLAIVQAIPELESRTGRKPTVIGGLAVLSRLGTAYRATSDLDTVSRRATGDPPQVDVLLAAGARRAGPAGVWIQTSAGMVQVDIIEVTDAELSQLPDDETDRLAVLSHAWAIETATRMRVRVASQSEVPDTEVIVRVAEPGPLIAMKLQSIMNRPAAKERTDLLDVVRLTLDSTVGPSARAQLHHAGAQLAADASLHAHRWFIEQSEHPAGKHRNELPPLSPERQTARRMRSVTESARCCRRCRGTTRRTSAEADRVPNPAAIGVAEDLQQHVLLAQPELEQPAACGHRGP